MPTDTAAAAANLDRISIVYEDNDVLAINKPIDIAVHGDGVRDEYTVADWFLAREPAAVEVGEVQFSTQTGVQLNRAGVVHRLDRATSGVLLLCKHADAYVHCKAQFHDRLVEKEYRAFVYGVMSESRGTIDRSIGRSAKDGRKRSAERGARGTLRSAVTHWEVIQQGVVDGERFAYLKLWPKTGRMHQLRVHLKAIGRPIVGDVLYAGTRLEQSSNLGLERLGLHAQRLVINLPTAGDTVLTAPEPPQFTTAAGRIAEDTELW